MNSDTVTIEIDLYRDIHKGLRHALFDTTYRVGRLDPTDDDAVREAVAAVHETMALLAAHHAHEDQPVLEDLIETYAGEYRSVIDEAHQVLAVTIAGFPVTADELAAAPADRRSPMAHRLYLELAAFTSDYLAHLDVEERIVMPAIAAGCPTEQLRGAHAAIVMGIPLPDKVRGMKYMLPAATVADRAVLLGQVKTFAPPEVFEPLRAVAERVLTAQEYAQVATLIGIA